MRAGATAADATVSVEGGSSSFTTTTPTGGPPPNPFSSTTTNTINYNFRRVVMPKHMDVAYALWQMRVLALSGPKAVYRHATYRKQTKNQWGRDDPTFCVLTSLFVAASAIGYCAMYERRGVGKAAWVVLSAVCFDYIGCGCVIATAYWFLANRYMRVKSSGRGRGSTRHAGTTTTTTTTTTNNNNNNHVEWLFAFDVHCNSFVPLFVALYLGQLILSPLLVQRGFICALLSNILFCLSLSYYHYCQFVGFNSLPHLERTEYLLYPVVALVVLVIPLSVVQFNPTRWVLSWYFGSEVLQ